MVLSVSTGWRCQRTHFTTISHGPHLWHSRMSANCLGWSSRIILQSLLIREPWHNEILILISQTSTPATYTKYVAREMSKAEHLLKVRQTNHGWCGNIFQSYVQLYFCVTWDAGSSSDNIPGSTIFVYSPTHSKCCYFSILMFFLISIVFSSIRI